MQTDTVHGINLAHKAYALTASLLAFALVIGLSAYTGVFKPSGETADTWFKRSGALIMCLAYFAGMAYYRASKRRHSNDHEASKDASHLRFARTFVFATILMGITIFGFGDLIYQMTH